MGKGSNRRPMQVSQEELNRRWEKAFHKEVKNKRHNGGRDALLCNECSVVLATGTDHDLGYKYICASCLQTSAKWQLKGLKNVYVRTKFNLTFWIPIEEVRYEEGTIIFLTVTWQTIHLDEVVIVKFKPEN